MIIYLISREQGIIYIYDTIFNRLRARNYVIYIYIYIYIYDIIFNKLGARKLYDSYVGTYALHMHS